MAFTRRQENLVAAFRGFPSKNIKGRIKKTSSINELMDSLINKHKLLKPRIEAELMGQWGYIVGEHNAHCCAPQRIENNALRIACAHPVMVREMTFNKKMILRRLQGVCPTIRDVKFVTG